MFSVKYINTLNTIAEYAEVGLVDVIQDDTIAAVKELKGLPEFDGRNNPETAYHFMVMMGKVSDSIVNCHEQDAVQFKLCQGQIARQLSTNPGYPKNALSSLAGGLISEAQAHAVNGDLEAVRQAITEASNLGYSEFEELQSDKLLARLENREAFLKHIEQLESVYAKKMKQWSVEAISQFPRFQFQFDVNNVIGGHLSSANYKNKILVVDLWATWCPPCRKGIPHFVRLQKELSGEGVQVLGIAMDSPEDPSSSVDKVLAFLKKQKVNYPCGLGTNELKQKIPGDVKLPTTLFIDRQGNVRYVATGYHDYTKIAALTKALVNESHPVSKELIIRN